jgi:biotin carboxylase
MRVLVVGTNRMCHDRLRDHGHEVVLFVPKSRARPGDPAGSYQHVVVLGDDAPVDQWVDIARVLHRGDPFGAVAAFNEHTYPIVCAISAEVGIPTVVDVELFHRVLDKSVTRGILACHDVPSCRYELARGRDRVHAAIAAIGVPCIVKPVAGEASTGVVRVDAADDVEAVLRRLGADLLDQGVLVEQFLVGEEFSIEAISVGRTHHIVAITKKFANEHTFVERGHLVPAALDEPSRQAISEYVRQVLDALGFHDCPSHTEIILTAHGPRLVETHNRIGGDSIMDLVQLATGVDLNDLVARQSIGEDVTALLPDPVEAMRSAVIWYADPSGPATNTLAEVRNVERARAVPNVVRVDLLREPGSVQTDVLASGDRSASAIAVGTTPHEALDAARAAVRALEFVYVWNPEAAVAPPR